jgi:hypothetical protein
MHKFFVMIHGVNFLIREDDTSAPKLMGFYINAYVEADSPNDAELKVVELVRTSPKLRPKVANALDDPPRMFLEKIEAIRELPTDRSIPLSGFVFYEDPDAEWRNEYHVRKLP